MHDSRRRWNEKYRDPDCSMPDRPTPELERQLERLPDGRALDVAAGTGRNALFLADDGYTVDAFDVSDEALETASQRAEERNVDVSWIHADADSYCYPENVYDLVDVTLFHTLERFDDILGSLKPDGGLFYKSQLRSDADYLQGPRNPDCRLKRNELLQRCSDLHVIYYEEKHDERDDGRLSTTAAVVARKR